MERLDKESKEYIFESNEFLFAHAISELSYIKKSIDLIDENLASSIDKLNLEYKEELQNNFNDNSYGLDFDEFSKTFMHLIDDSSNILSTINESIIVKLYSILEKSIIAFTYEMQGFYNCKIPPHFNMQKNRYTDIISASEYINSLSNFNLKELKTWDIINNLRTIRNRLSHGNTLLNITEDESEVINKNFEKYFNKSKIPLLKEIRNDKNISRVNDDIKILYIIRDVIAKTILILDYNYHTMKQNNYIEHIKKYEYGGNTTENILDFINE